MGTPAYMSPEQCRGGGQVIDARADIYSLGCILYEMICGRRLFKHEALGEMLLAHVMDWPESPLALVPDLPLRLNTLVMRMLAKEPSARPQTMDEVFAEIVKCLKGLGTQVPPGEIVPKQHVIVQQPPSAAEADQERSASQPSAPGTPPGWAAPPASSDEAAIVGDTRFGLGGARLGLRGTQFLPPDKQDDEEREYAAAAPTSVPTTFGEAVGQDASRPGGLARGSFLRRGDLGRGGARGHRRNRRDQVARRLPSDRGRRRNQLDQTAQGDRGPAAGWGSPSHGRPRHAG